MAFDFRKKITTTATHCYETPIEIYLGIDFGTTFTKVSFQVGGKEGTTKYSLKFEVNGDETDYCLPSVLGYDTVRGVLVFTQVPEEDGLDAVRYFKYSMIEKGVPRNKNLEDGGTKNDPQRLCSAFYIAHVIKITKEHVLRHRAVSGKSTDIHWYVNMGVPVSDFNAKPKPIYDEALNVAWNLADSAVLQDEMALADLDAFYSRYVSHSTWSNRLNTVPELYAELIMFLQDKSVDTGFYSVIDIGGGTVDMAVFFKRIDQYSKKVEISCVAQEVCPLGYELYVKVLDQKRAGIMMRTSYVDLVNVAYQQHRTEMKKAKEDGRSFVHFFMGGARGVDFYHDRVDEVISWDGDHWLCYPGANEDDIVHYLRHKSNLDVRGNRRLLISQMLAQPFESMPELVGQPWHFQRRTVFKDAPSAADLQLSIYGD